MVEALRNFDIGLDELRVTEKTRKADSVEERMAVRDILISYNSDQMITNLGERFNVILSTYQYEIRDGQLWGKDMEEPFMESLRCGRDYRRENGNAVDYKREDAEVVGFGRIQDVMADEDTPAGTMMLSISPPGLDGSTYANNFIDIHVKRAGAGGSFFVESQRVSSGLSMDEYKEKISAFSDIEIDENDPSASFLEQPIMINGGLTAEDIKFYFYREHDYMDEQSFEAIKKSVAHLTEEYAKSLVDRPNDTNYHKLLFNAALNKADEVAEQIKTNGIGVVEKVIPIPTNYNIRHEIQDYGYREVEEVRAGCGISGGYDVNESNGDSPNSVSEFDPKKDKVLCCTCPYCNEKVEAVIKNGRIKCPRRGCGRSAKWSD